MTQPPVVAQPAQSSPGVLQFTGPQALAPQSSLRGTQMLAATIQAPPLLGYYYGILALAGDLTVIKRALNAIADQTADAFETMLQAAYDSLGLQRGSPWARLQFYIKKTPQTWAEQQAKYPKDFAEDKADYDSLLLKAQNGDIGPEPIAGYTTNSAFTLGHGLLGT